jgi:[acyl-carrier-protein] S-malonyltransferase
VTTAFVFPGQASQYVGVGQDLVKEYPIAKSIFDQADAILGIPLSQICFTGPEDILTDTINNQPALLTHSVATLRIIQSRSPNLVPVFVAGHSLGEYSALVAADVMDFADALKLVRARGRAMQHAGIMHPGMMAAVLGLADTELESVCHQTGTQIANYNAPGQIVISGSRPDMEKAISLAKERGARRVVPLAVSIAAHSRWMQTAAQEFSQAVADTPMRTPTFPIVSNVTARPLKPDEIRSELIDQLTSPVQWVRSVQYMVEHGATRFIEVGPKDVLAGLVRRIDKNVHAISIGDVATVKAFGESKAQGD